MESFLTSAPYAALILFGFLEAACIPIPSEVTFGFAGVLAYQGHLNLVLVIIIGSLAELAGSYASYAVGRVGGKPLVHRWGRYVLVTQGDVDRAERFLAGRGSWAIAVGRMLPFIRAFTSIVAGLVRVPAGRFGVFSLIGTVIYATVLSVIGYQVGHAWGSINHGLTIATYILVAIVVIAIVGFVLYRLRQFRREAAQAKDQAQAVPDQGAATQEPTAQAPAAQAPAAQAPPPARRKAPVRCRGLTGRRRPGRSARVRSRAPARPG